MNYSWDAKLRDTVWGIKHSVSAQTLYKILASLHHSGDIELVDVGAGYFRDAVFLASKGYTVRGYEISEEGVNKGRELALEKGVDGQIELINEDFLKSSDQRKAHAIISHRLIHLFDDEKVAGFAKHAADILRDDIGLMVLGARCLNDFDPQQMEWVDKEKVKARYKEKKECKREMFFWDENKFLNAFGEHFDHFSFEFMSEVESRDNVDPSTGKVRETQLIIATAWKKSSKKRRIFS